MLEHNRKYFDEFGYDTGSEDESVDEAVEGEDVDELVPHVDEIDAEFFLWSDADANFDQVYADKKITIGVSDQGFLVVNADGVTVFRMGITTEMHAVCNANMRSCAFTIASTDSSSNWLAKILDPVDSNNFQ